MRAFRAISLLVATLLLSTCLTASSCSNPGSLSELLGDSAPTCRISGRVDYIADYLHQTAWVQIRASYKGEEEVIAQSGPLGATGGDYSVGFKWHPEVEYEICIVGSDGHETYREELGQIVQADIHKNLAA